MTLVHKGAETTTMSRKAGIHCEIPWVGTLGNAKLAMQLCILLGFLLAATATSESRNRGHYYLESSIKGTHCFFGHCTESEISFYAAYICDRPNRDEKSEICDADWACASPYLIGREDRFFSYTRVYLGYEGLFAYKKVGAVLVLLAIVINLTVYIWDKVCERKPHRL